MSTTIATASNEVPIYKGKVTHRSWPQLPEELIRQIATFYLWDLSATSYCPHSWETRDNWHQRMVYTALRDANELEKHFMSICPQWCQALETHLFWQQAIALIDPGDVLAHYAIVHPKGAALNSSSAPALPTRLSPHRHFRNITSCSCIVCRINRPTTSAGLTYGKRYLVTPWLKTIQLCRDHDRRRIAFCGLCLREQPIFDNSMRAPALHAAEIAGDANVACLENEDEDTWPGVDATCRSCRSEWLWKRMCSNPEDREAIGGSRMVSDDWETRQSVDGFIDMAEGSINDVVTLAREKWWLRKHTRLAEYVMQAVAAAKFNNGRVGYDGSHAEEEEEMDEDEEDEEELELMQMSEENGIRDIALGDWARARILDGYWCSPADSWYNNALPGRPMAVQALHPCPWARETPPSEASSPLPDSDDDEDHPKQSTSEAEHPPTFSLCEQAYLAHQRQMRVVLMPAMRNIVRKVVIECSIPNPIDDRVEDPAIRAARMDLEDVLRELREEEGVWFDGVDWAERRRNDGREREKRARENASASDDSSTSSGSRSSNGTSPVLSTTTLQTTPSPPPIPLEDNVKKTDAREEEEEDPLELTITTPAKLPIIAVGPVLDPPKLLWPIPYVPVTAAHMPHYSIEAFKMVWREACAPLYHCRCSVCERAAAKANAANPPPPAVVPSQVQQQDPRPTADVDRQPATIRLDEVIDVDGEGEDELEEVYEEEEEEEEDDGVEEITEPLSPSLEALRDRLGPDIKLLYWNGRKRSSHEVDAEDDDDNASVDVQRGGTPPKRIRFDKGEPLLSETGNTPLHTKLKKRSSEELEDAGVADKQNKKAKVSTVVEGDLSESPPPTSDYSLPSSTTDGGQTEGTDDLDYIFRGAERCGSLEGGEG